MELIFLAALCSVLVSILLKKSKTKGFDLLQMIAWNYAVGSILCFFWFKPDLVHISVQNTPWWLITVLAVVLPTIFVFLSKSLDSAGILKTEIAQRLSVVLSLAAAYFLFDEQFNSLKWIGIALGLVAVMIIVLTRSVARDSPDQNHKAMLYLLCVWIGYALVDVLLKYTTSLGLQFAVSLNLMFIMAFVLCVGYLALQKTEWSARNLAAGMLLGILNFANIALYVKAHILLKDSPAIVFAGMNILVVVLGVIAGLVVFKERLNFRLALGILLGIAGVMCLALSI
mgnify:CR=1 FL=1